MSKQKAATSPMFFQEIFSLHIYKRSQGRISRQITCGVIWLTFAIAAWKLKAALVLWVPDLWLQYAIAALLLATGLWLGYRMVNYPRFADFLIAVEAEMNKVSWPSRGELVRSAMVVIFVIFALAFVLFGYDIVWKFLFRTLGILQY